MKKNTLRKTKPYKAQAIVEYAIVVAVIIAAILAFSGGLKDKIKTGLDNTVQSLVQGTASLSGMMK